MTLAAALDRLPSPVVRMLRRVFVGATDLNYRLGLLASAKSVEGVGYRSYDLLNLYADDVLLQRMIRDVAPGDVVYDVGANAGDFGIALALAADGVRVVAVEPHPWARERLGRNLAVNGLEDHVEVLAVALSDATGEATLHMARPHDGRSSFHPDEIERGPTRAVDATTVPTAPLDDVVEDRGLAPPDMLKIDVERHGPAVLRGATRTLERHGPTVYFEPHGDTLETVRSFLADRGYEERSLGYPSVFTPA